ncbi:flavin-binding monooxygenase-like family protein [Fusarium solani]|uniref:Flavin-binding monooxygenase-like family protein n=1 Tax=Fusarium solani TaxID=169388 RepID=A0A9P9G403_FUSSL|nr:flavin-binding monooxygenase-like family protein [Fusarium solani]KAH7232720.1 flavin-binding monooxygenase-like family protein [Fusarium solani]
MTAGTNAVTANNVFLQTLAKYEEERQKRQRSDGLAQYIDPAKSEKFKHYTADPWVEADQKNRTQPLPPPPVADGGHAKVLILGAGYGALLFAVRLLETGVFKANDIVFVDAAGGFGGVWYWNRYPGLMCDVESASYLPLLEETGYVPKDRYAYGTELREYAELVASKWNIQGQGLWHSTIRDSTWDETNSNWVHILSKKKSDGPEETLTVRSDFYVLIPGWLARPKLPRIPGLVDFGGHIFHTARWDYNYTGQKVAFLGTGATGIQVVPQLAKWCKKLYVIQRTPAAVDVRGQAPIDPAQWLQDTAEKGWQRRRRENMAARLSNYPDVREDLVGDGWTSFPSLSGLVGGPASGNLTEKTVEDYVKSLLALDFPRQEGIRSRVSAIVKDPAVAESLKPWYPGWCKRPCFHDEYLQAFNNPNVELIDTDGKGVKLCTKAGLVAGGKEFDVDLLILGTGFEPWTAGSPAYCANVTVKGRGGIDMNQKWSDGVGTLHGAFTRGFPNLILPGTTQAGPTVNIVHAMDVTAQHVAYVLSEASRQQAANRKKILVEPTAEGEAEWVLKIIRGAYAFGTLSICTPSYTTREGEMTSVHTPEEQMKLATGSMWAKGMIDYTQYLEAWKASGDLKGIEVHGV